MLGLGIYTVVVTVPFVGADQAANLLEVGVIDSSDGPIIVHAMPARPKYLR